MLLKMKIISNVPFRAQDIKNELYNNFKITNIVQCSLIIRNLLTLSQFKFIAYIWVSILKALKRRKKGNLFDFFMLYTA